MESIIILIVMGSIIAYQGVINYIEKDRAFKREQDLLNKLMSKDFTEYTLGTTELAEPPKSEKLVELEEEIKLRELRGEEDRFPVA